MILDAPWIHQGTTWRNIHTGATLPINPPGTDPDPPIEPPIEPPGETPVAPASWQTAIDAHDVRQVALWYDAHTGISGINPDNPDDLPLTEADLEATTSGIDSTHDGQVIEGKITSRIRIRHNNVTVRRCLIRPSLTGLYAIHWDPVYGATFTGARVEFCTIEPPEGSHAAPAMMRGNLTAETAMTFRHNLIVNTTTGGRFENRIVAEYNYYRDFQHPDGGHASGTRFMGDHGTARRNLITDASSSNLGMYLDQGGMNYVTYEENILGGTIDMGNGRVISPLASPSYAMSLGMGGLQLEPHGLRVINNWFYGGYQYGLTAGDLPWGQFGNVRSGNRALQDFVIQPDSGSNRREYTAGELLPFNDE